MLKTVEHDSNVGSSGSTNEGFLFEYGDGPLGWSPRIGIVASSMSWEYGGLDLVWTGELYLPTWWD